MRKHSERRAYYISDGYIINEPPDLFGDPNHVEPPSAPAPFKFKWMFKRADAMDSPQREAMIHNLTQLGRTMSASPPVSDLAIPSGYTYLGQYIAHEITFDQTQDLPEVELAPEDYRSPSLDLDSLYGPEPRTRETNPLYDPHDPNLLRVGTTFETKQAQFTYDNDLPRDRETGKAFIVDERNDENLPVAQIHVAFIKFHNKMVEVLRSQGVSEQELFDRAREQVIKHFQLIILKDFLFQVLDRTVLESVIDHPQWFKVKDKDNLFMPLEFSAAAFRFGHSMVRPAYEWNQYHSSLPISISSQAPISELFNQTKFSGSIGSDSGKPRLTSDWVINWRHFFDFDGFPYPKPHALNMANKIDTSFGFDLTKIPGFQHHGLTGDQQLLPARNLLRGFALGLLTGEEVAKWIGETPLTPDKLGAGPAFTKKTPLWYYILKEAELEGKGKLGKVGSTIVAETMVGLIRFSDFSILSPPEWRPLFGRPIPETGDVKCEMVDMLHFADVVDPIGQHFKDIYGHWS